MESALTPLQRAYLLGRSQQLPLGGVAMQEFREYRGRIDGEALRERLRELVRRHACLRTRIDPVRLVQRVFSDVQINLEEVDLRGGTRADALQRIEGMREEFAHQPCDLERAPWQITLFRFPVEPGAGDSEVAFLRFDALCMDGRAIAWLVAELFNGKPLADQGPSSSASIVSSGRNSEDAAYWAEKLSAVTGPPRLPWTRPLETIATSRYARNSLVIPRERFSTLTRIGARQHLFVNATLSALVLEVLSRWHGEGPLCVGMPVALQEQGELANHSSFLALVWEPGNGTMEQRARTLQSDVLCGLQHLSFSGVDLSRLLTQANHVSPALPVVITNGLAWPSVERASQVRLQTALTMTPQVALDVRFGLDCDRNLLIEIDFAREATDPAIVREMLGALERAIDAICVKGALALDAREILRYEHYRFNAHPELTSDCFLTRIADHLFERPTDRPALICGTRRISYRELGAQVKRVMTSLRARRVDVVAVCLPRSPEHAVVSVACALLGIVWVPVDAASPPDRVRYMLENCRAQLVVAQADIDGFPCVTPDALSDPSVELGAQTPALEQLSMPERRGYYLYTSGTTGQPKCVVVSNRATANVIARTLEAWKVTQRDVFISVTPLHHDMAVFDVFGCLTAGATLVMPTQAEERDAIRWNQLVEQHRVSLWCSVPAILEMLLACRRGDELTTLRLIAQGGDYIKAGTIAELRRLLPNARLFSLGGPTETTIWSIWHELGLQDVEVIPYGRPVPPNRYFVLNDRGEHCPSGVVGRIHTAGVNVALGYLEAGVLVQHDFVTIDDEEGKPVRAFRSGDYGRYRPDGTLIFAGRVQGYVKVRGVRVSLAAIERELGAHEAILQALAVDFGVEHAGESAIGLLYVRHASRSPSHAELREFVRARLPESHVPARFVEVDALPLSRNGKPDRARAREILALRSEPNDRASQRLLAIYLSVLGGPPTTKVDDSTDFAALGLLPSHLKTIAARIHEELGVRLSPRQLLHCRNAQQVKLLCGA